MGFSEMLRGAKKLVPAEYWCPYGTWLALYSVSFKKRNWDSILNLSKSNRKTMKLLSVVESIFTFLSYGTLVIHIGSGMACSAIIFVKHVKTLFVQVHNAVWMHELLLCCELFKLPQMPSCSANNANLDKNNFDMIYKIDCCAAIHGWIWMNNVPNESRIILNMKKKKNLKLSKLTRIQSHFWLFDVVHNWTLLLLVHLNASSPPPPPPNSGFTTETEYWNVKS